MLGASCVLVFVALQSAIFWGQYANCEDGGARVGHVRLLGAVEVGTPGGGGGGGGGGSGSESPRAIGAATGRFRHRQLTKLAAECSNRGGMRAACAFSVFMFLAYLFFILVLFRFKVSSCPPPFFVLS